MPKKYTKDSQHEDDNRLHPAVAAKKARLEFKNNQLFGAQWLEEFKNLLKYINEYHALVLEQAIMLDKQEHNLDKKWEKQAGKPLELIEGLKLTDLYDKLEKISKIEEKILTNLQPVEKNADDNKSKASAKKRTTILNKIIQTFKRLLTSVKETFVFGHHAKDNSNARKKSSKKSKLD